MSTSTGLTVRFFLSFVFFLTSRLSMAESLQTCHGLTDNVRCDCEELTPSPSNPSLCEECGHGKSKHPRTARLSCPEPKTVTDIFKYHVGKQSASGSASVSFEDARRDALKGFKTSSDDSTPKSASKVHRTDIT